MVGKEHILNQKQGVSLAAAQPVQFIDQNLVDVSGLDILDHLLESGAVHRRSALATVSVDAINRPPHCGAVLCGPVDLFIDAVSVLVLLLGADANVASDIHVLFSLSRRTIPIAISTASKIRENSASVILSPSMVRCLYSS